jgi:hypothetical protein
VLWAAEGANPRPGFHEQDRPERAARAVCARRLSLRKAQSLIARNWVAAFSSRAKFSVSISRVPRWRAVVRRRRAG